MKIHFCTGQYEVKLKDDECSYSFLNKSSSKIYTYTFSLRIFQSTICRFKPFNYTTPGLKIKSIVIVEFQIMVEIRSNLSICLYIKVQTKMLYKVSFVIVTTVLVKPLILFEWITLDKNLWKLPSHMYIK